MLCAWTSLSCASDQLCMSALHCFRSARLCNDLSMLRWPREHVIRLWLLVCRSDYEGSGFLREERLSTLEQVFLKFGGSASRIQQTQDQKIQLLGYVTLKLLNSLPVPVITACLPSAMLAMSPATTAILSS